MNQSIIFNDDLHFDEKIGMWTFSGLIDGALMTINVHQLSYSYKLEITQNTKFDLEELVENWLEKNEPTNNHIVIG